MSDTRRTLRVFISSPADVRPERLKAEQIIARLGREFAYYFNVEAVLWERAPLVATRHFQDPENIPQPRGMDIVAVIVWSRLGVPLPADQFRGAISGDPVTGTEWEFEEALAGSRERSIPDLLLYRKTANPVMELGDRSAVQERLDQLELVERFISRWFRSADDKSFTAALHTFTDTAEFEEQLYEHLRALLSRRVGAATDAVAISWYDAPFRGLLRFEYEHSAIFFGRTRARNELRELLTEREAAQSAFILVLGASGSGKSSLVRAGLLPDLQLPGMVGPVGLVRWGLTQPSNQGGDLFDALAASILSATALPELAALGYTHEALAELLRGAQKQAALPIRQGLASAGTAAGLTQAAEARLALLVDQFEELFTIDSINQEMREAYVTALAALAQSGLVWVIATMRSDFFDRLEALPELAELSSEGRYLLLPPSDAEIAQIIRQPAYEAGLRFEAEPGHAIGLDEIIREAAAAESGTLPLLSFLLDQLWRMRGENGVLTLAAYRELGGLEGAIGRRAEEVFQDQPEHVRHELVPVLRALVTVRGGRATSRAAPLSLFAPGSARRALVEALLDPSARLLIADADSGGAQLRVAHEALLTHWPRVHEQIVADTRDLELRGRLEHAAENWHNAPPRERNGRVAVGLFLTEGRALVARWGEELPALVRDYVAESRRVARRRVLHRIAAVAGALIALPLIAGIVWAGVVWWGVRSVEAEMKFVTVPAGCFDMGSPFTEVGRFQNEGPVHHVCLDAFAIGQYEVTQSEWQPVLVFINATPSFFKGDERRPVESVSWNEAQFFIKLMSFFGRHAYRLPSEEEWEYAARGGTKTSRFWGERAEDGCDFENMADASLKHALPDAVVANCDDGFATTAPVGSFRPNPFGLYDMLGNVAEWTEDCYADYAKPPDAVSDCATRTVRGGSWNIDPRFLRAADRSGISPNVRSGYIGFRLVRTSKK